MGGRVRWRGEIDDLDLGWGAGFRGPDMKCRFVEEVELFRMNQVRCFESDLLGRNEVIRL